MEAFARPQNSHHLPQNPRPQFHHAPNLRLPHIPPHRKPYLPLRDLGLDPHRRQHPPKQPCVRAASGADQFGASRDAPYVRQTLRPAGAEARRGQLLQPNPRQLRNLPLIRRRKRAEPRAEQEINLGLGRDGVSALLGVGDGEDPPAAERRRAKHAVGRAEQVRLVSAREPRRAP